MSLLAILKLAGSAVWRFLSSLSLWQAIALGLAVFALVQHFQLADARHDRDAYLKQRDEYRAQLDKLSAESRARQKETTKVIVHHETVVKPEAERRAKIIEDAPIVPGKCETPREVLSADI